MVQGSKQAERSGKTERDRTTGETPGLSAESRQKEADREAGQRRLFVSDYTGVAYDERGTPVIWR